MVVETDGGAETDKKDEGGPVRVEALEGEEVLDKGFVGVGEVVVGEVQAVDGADGEAAEDDVGGLDGGTGAEVRGEEGGEGGLGGGGEVEEVLLVGGDDEAKVFVEVVREGEGGAGEVGDKGFGGGGVGGEEALGGCGGEEGRGGGAGVVAVLAEEGVGDGHGSQDVAVVVPQKFGPSRKKRATYCTVSSA